MHSESYFNELRGVGGERGRAVVKHPIRNAAFTVTLIFSSVSFCSALDDWGALGNPVQLVL